MAKFSKILSITAILCSLTISSAFSTVVKIDGYNFPPFVEKDGKEGLVQELIQKLNKTQSTYQFVFKLTSSNRRYSDLKSHKFDAIFFEDEAWGWTQEQTKFQKTGILLTGGEVYVALNKPGRDQQFFDSFKNKKIRGIFGYHYNFANMETNPEFLRKQGISLGQSNEENLKDLLNGTVNIIVINTFMIKNLLDQRKDLVDKILISQKMDQKYQLRFFLNNKSPISNTEIEKMVSPLLK